MKQIIKVIAVVIALLFLLSNDRDGVKSIVHAKENNFFSSSRYFHFEKGNLVIVKEIDRNKYSSCCLV